MRHLPLASQGLEQKTRMQIILTGSDTRYQTSNEATWTAQLPAQWTDRSMQSAEIYRWKLLVAINNKATILLQLVEHSMI